MSNMVILGFVLIVVLFALGAPIWVAMSTGASIMLIGGLGISSSMIPITFWGNVDSFTLMACPFFMIAGNIMAHGGCSPYIFNFVNAWVGRLRGGIPIATVLTSMIFAAITGSTAATLSAIAAICLPQLRRAGYSDKFSAGLMACSATLGQLIPPSVMMIVYGSLTNISAADLFLSGFIPGVICGGAIAAVAVIKSPPADQLVGFDKSQFSWNNKVKTLYQGIPALLMPIIVLGGIYAGIVTPTEAGALSCVYGVLICLFLYRTMSIKEFKLAMGESAYSNAMVFTLVAASMLFANPLTYLQIPQAVASFVINAGLSKLGLIFGIVVVYLILGCFLDALPIIYLVVPIVLPALKNAGVDLIHFNIITIISMQIGQITPPFGLSLYMTSKLADTPLTSVIKESFPYLLTMIAVLVLIILVPGLSTCLTGPAL